MDAYKLDEQMKDVHFDRSDAIHYVQEEYVAIVEIIKFSSESFSIFLQMIVTILCC